MDLKTLQSRLNYQFQNPSLLLQALTHRSYLNETKVSQSNERLEFLGDAVLELIISEFLFAERPNEPEGILTAARSAIVRTETLAHLARNLSLGQYLLMSKGEEKSGGRDNLSLLANSVEALIGAIYLDSGFSNAQKFVTGHLLPVAKATLSGNLKDAKSLLQEKVQEMGFPSPLYKTLKELGPDHAKTFTVAVFVNGLKLTTGTGRNKQTAQQAAAKKALKTYQQKLAIGKKA